MKFNEAKNLEIEIGMLMEGTSHIGKRISTIYTSYREKTLAENHFINYKFGLNESFNEKYEGEYTLWAMLEDDTFVPVRTIIINDKIQDLMPYVERLL